MDPQTDVDHGRFSYPMANELAYTELRRKGYVQRRFINPFPEQTVRERSGR